MSLIPLRATELVVVHRPWEWAVREQARIAAHWAAQAKGNSTLFDGRVLVAWHYEIVDDVLRGSCLETDFSKFLAWRDFGFPDTSIVNIFAMAALRAEDGAYLMGVMGQHTANPGRIYFPAGTPDPNDVVDGSVDLAGSVIRELMEETGLGTGDVTIGSGVGHIGTSSWRFLQAMHQNGRCIATCDTIIVCRTDEAAKPLRAELRAALEALLIER